MLARANAGRDAESEATPAGGGFFPPRSARHSARAARNFAQADFSPAICPRRVRMLWSNLALALARAARSRVSRMAARAQGERPADVQHARSRHTEGTARRVCARWRRRTVCRPRHVIDFVDMHDLGDMLVESGFEIPVMDQEVLTITYKSPQSLLRMCAAGALIRVRARRRKRMRRACLAAVTRRCWRRLEARRRADGTLAADLRGDLRTRMESRAAHDRRRARDRAARGHWPGSVEESMNRKEGICYV
jgi:malonyl-CoA O-methyltransferase